MVENKTKWWKNPTVLIVIGTAIIGLATSFVTYHIQPLSAKIEMLQTENKEMKKALSERPTLKELKPEIQAIKDNVQEVKEAQKENDKKLDEIYKLLLKINN